MRPVKKIALLHDICSVGKAAMMNMTPILSMMGIEACPIPTVLLSTHLEVMEHLPYIMYPENIYVRVRITIRKKTLHLTRFL